MREFPLDDTTLLILSAACEINPDSGHTELLPFLDMGACIKNTEDISDDVANGGAPVYLVEYEEGYEPYALQEVIKALVAEILRLRAAERTIT